MLQGFELAPWLAAVVVEGCSAEREGVGFAAAAAAVGLWSFRLSDKAIASIISCSSIVVGAWIAAAAAGFP